MGPDLPIGLVVDQSGRAAVTTEIPIDTRGTQIGTRESIAERDIGGNDTDAAGSALEDLVADEESFHLVAEGEEFVHGHMGVGDPTLGEIVLEATDPVEVRMEPTPGGGLDLIEHMLAVAEGIEASSHTAELQTEIAEEQRDVGDA